MKAEDAVRVVFQVFHKPQGPFLANCLVPNDFSPQNFTDRAGKQFRSTKELGEALKGLQRAPDGSYIVGLVKAQELGIQV